jgi:hypothetical protein
MASAGSGWIDKVTNEMRKTARNAGDGRNEAPIFICFFFSREAALLGLYVHQSLETSIYRELEGRVFR